MHTHTFCARVHGLMTMCLPTAEFWQPPGPACGCVCCEYAWAKSLNFMRLNKDSHVDLVLLLQNPKKAGEEIAKTTQQWKGVKVTVRLRIQNRQISAEVVPSATSLIIKALKEPVRDRKKVKNIKHSGNLTMDTIIDIARQMRAANRGIISRTLKGTVMEILGTANAVGCTIDGRKPTDIQAAINDQEIEIPAQ